MFGSDWKVGTILTTWLVTLLWLVYKSAYLARRACARSKRGARGLPSFVCPITKDVMCDPIVCADGHSYERAAMDKWMSDAREESVVFDFDHYSGRVSSPITGAELLPSHTIPNHALRKAIEEWQCSYTRQRLAMPLQLLSGLRRVSSKLVESPIRGWFEILRGTPPSFLCPLTGKLMRDPVILNDGHSCERSAAERWMETAGLSPEQQVAPEPDSIGWDGWSEMRLAPDLTFYPLEFVVDSPCTGEELPGMNLWVWPNHALRHAIQQWHTANV